METGWSILWVAGPRTEGGCLGAESWLSEVEREVLGLTFWLQGSLHGPFPSVFLLEATDLNSQLSMDETYLLLSLLMLGLRRHPKWS